VVVWERKKVLYLGEFANCNGGTKKHGPVRAGLEGRKGGFSLKPTKGKMAWRMLVSIAGDTSKAAHEALSPCIQPWLCFSWNIFHGTWEEKAINSRRYPEGFLFLYCTYFGQGYEKSLESGSHCSSLTTLPSRGT